MLRAPGPTTVFLRVNPDPADTSCDERHERLDSLPGVVAPAGQAGPTMPALAMQAAAMASTEALVATLLNGAATPRAAALARSLASLSVLDPATELARLGG